MTTPPAGIRNRSDYSPELESLRGVAIVLVFLYHAEDLVFDRELLHPGLAVSPVGAFVTGGQTGVSLFFVLSAFLLARPFLLEASGQARVSRKGFFARRLLRIMPAYALAVSIATAVNFETLATLGDAAGHLVFLNSFAGVVEPLMPFSGVWWSLATEAQFYLLLPLLPWVLRAKAAVGAAVLLGYAALYGAVVTGTLSMGDLARLMGRTPSSGDYEAQLMLLLSLVGRAPLFAAGIAAAALHLRYGAYWRQELSRVRWLRRGGADLLLAATLLLLGLLLQRVVAAGFWVAEIGWHYWHIAEGILWAAVVLQVLVCPLSSRPLWRSRPLQLVGVVSYSLYLWHFPVASFVMERARALASEPLVGWDARSACAITLSLALGLGVSAITYRFVERPFLLRKARLSTG